MVAVSCPGCADFIHDRTTNAVFQNKELKCHQFLVEFDDLVQSSGAADTMDTRISGFPYLRVDRFLASFKEELAGRPQIEEWVRRTRRLGDQGRISELANLAESQVQKVFPHSDKKTLAQALDQCAIDMADYAASHPDVATELIENTEIEDDYSTMMRVAGLYPISRWVILSGLKGLHDEARDRFQNLSDKEKSDGNWYFPESVRPDLTPDKLNDILSRAKANSALSIPEPPENELNLLFDYFSPVWHVLDYPESNRIGRPFWNQQDRIDIDTTAGVTYRYASFTRIGYEILLQLNYVIWFPSRPATGIFDIYSGNIDGLIWRVTLNPDGRVLLYDSVHCCGCYHKYFPVSSDLTPLENPPSPEAPLILNKDIPDNEKSRIVIHLSGREHYVIGLSQADTRSAGFEAYQLEPYEHLLRLPHQNGYKNMFENNHLISGSQRMERWLVWPSGVLSAGAMRQRGHHALALVGRQHFDDPRLFETVFVFK